MTSINQLFKKLSAALDPEQPQSVSSQDIERVSAILLVEIARADHQVDETEREVIVAALARSSSLEADALEALVTEALEEAQATHSLHSHISVVNEHFAKEEKIALVEQMWRVAMADGDLDRYEDYTIRKLCDLLFIKHRDFMQAKHRVMSDPD